MAVSNGPWPLICSSYMMGMQAVAVDITDKLNRWGGVRSKHLYLAFMRLFLPGSLDADGVAVATHLTGARGEGRGRGRRRGDRRLPR